MKKLTATIPVSFRYDGSILLEIDEDGCMASDAVAAVAKDRLGDQIVVEDAGPDGGHKEESDENENGDDNEDDSMSYADLKAKVKELGLPVSGTKAELQERIDAYNEEHKDDAPAE